MLMSLQRFQMHLSTRLPHAVPPLAVPKNHHLASQIDQHPCTDLSRVRPILMLGHILSRQGQGVASDCSPDIM
jgi:hypothetical protein